MKSDIMQASNTNHDSALAPPVYSFQSLDFLSVSPIGIVIGIIGKTPDLN